MRPFLCLVLVALWLSGAGWPVPQRTEGLRIAIAHEMASEGHWVVPTLWGEPILTKPPAFYWALMAAETVLPGWGLTAYRLVSVIALFGIALLAAGFLRSTTAGRTLTGNERLVLALLILPLSLAALGQLPSAEMDLAFSFWVIAFWLTALKLGSSSTRTVAGFLFGWLGLGCLGGVAVLFKWTAPAFFVPAGAWFWLFGRLNIGGKIAATILCALPMALLPAGWLVAVGTSAGWPLLIDTLWSEAMPHLSPTHHTRSYPFSEWVTYPLQVIGMALPAALPVLLRIPKWIKNQDRWQAAGESRTLGLLFMIAGSLILWTIIPGHRPRHALPIALGLVVASLAFWIDWIGPWLTTQQNRAEAGWSVMRIVLLVGLIGFAATKLGISLGGSRGRQDAARVLADAAMVRRHLEENHQKGDSLALYLGRFKDDGLVHLIGVRGIRWDPSIPPPGPVLCSSRDLAAFRLWNFTTEIPLLDQQGDSLYLLLKPQVLQSRRTDP